MGQLYNEDWEHVDIDAFREAIIGNGVISGIEVTQSATPAMTVAVSAGQCTIDGVVYSEASSQNLNISNGDATHDRKDIVVYDATAGNPAVVAGTPAAAPVPPDIPSGDILLGIVLVEANEVTSILNADITNDRVFTRIIKNVVVKCVSDNTILTTGNGKTHFTIPIELNGMNLITVGAHVYTASSSGTPTFMIHNLTDAVDMLSTAITIDASEKDSKDATTAAVINTSYDDVATGDELRFDCDVAGTGARGMEIRMAFRHG